MSLSAIFLHPLIFIYLFNSEIIINYSSTQQYNVTHITSLNSHCFQIPLFCRTSPSDHPLQSPSPVRNQIFHTTILYIFFSINITSSIRGQTCLLALKVFNMYVSYKFKSLNAFIVCFNCFEI